ncbi:MAG: glycosyltransferase [Coriobacteriia bacterium]|nr:glycosyltransferase [Coriobacteriia bacterium]
MGGDVQFTGHVYGTRLATLFRHTALFVLPSDLEGLPIVLLEAMAYGVPVLASDIAPNVEAAGNHGAFFAAGSVESLMERLADLLPHLTRSRRKRSSAGSRRCGTTIGTVSLIRQRSSTVRFSEPPPRARRSNLRRAGTPHTLNRKWMTSPSRTT